MARTFPTCGLWLDGDEVRLWIGDTEGAESEPLTDEQIDAFIRNLDTVKSMRGNGAHVTWVVPSVNAPRDGGGITPTPMDPTSNAFIFGVGVSEKEQEQ